MESTFTLTKRMLYVILKLSQSNLILDSIAGFVGIPLENPISTQRNMDAWKHSFMKRKFSTWAREFRWNDTVLSVSTTPLTLCCRWKELNPLLLVFLWMAVWFCNLYATIPSTSLQFMSMQNAHQCQSNEI